jgi:hypothetical protein
MAIANTENIYSRNLIVIPRFGGKGFHDCSSFTHLLATGA